MVAVIQGITELQSGTWSVTRARMAEAWLTSAGINASTDADVVSSAEDARQAPKASQRGITAVRNEMVAVEIMNTPAIRMA
jgi:hypothetical protein